MASNLRYGKPDGTEAEMWEALEITQAGGLVEAGRERCRLLTAFAAVAVLASLLLVDPKAWIPLRAVSGFCFAGAAMIVESWLNERATNENRGALMSTYIIINMTAIMAGQLVLTAVDPSGFTAFVLASVAVSLVSRVCFASSMRNVWT